MSVLSLFAIVLTMSISVKKWVATQIFTWKAAPKQQQIRHRWVDTVNKSNDIHSIKLESVQLGLNAAINNYESNENDKLPFCNIHIIHTSVIKQTMVAPLFYMICASIESRRASGRNTGKHKNTELPLTCHVCECALSHTCTKNAEI